MKINEGITLNRKLLDKTLSYSPWGSSSGRKRAEFAMFLTVCKSYTCMKHVVISIKSLHDLRQITLSSASSYVPCCVKSCTNLHQKACCFASSCTCTFLFLHCHFSFSVFFPDIFRFLFSCFLFFNPRFFQMFFDKVCTEIQSVLLSNVPYIFWNLQGKYSWWKPPPAPPKEGSTSLERLLRKQNEFVYKLISPISSEIFLDILRCRLRQGGLKTKGKTSYPLRGIF